MSCVVRLKRHSEEANWPPLPPACPRMRWVDYPSMTSYGMGGLPQYVLVWDGWITPSMPSYGMGGLPPVCPRMGWVDYPQYALVKDGWISEQTYRIDATAVTSLTD
jgi:hypothetical protein